MYQVFIDLSSTRHHSGQVCREDEQWVGNLQENRELEEPHLIHHDLDIRHEFLLGGLNQERWHAYDQIRGT